MPAPLVWLAVLLSTWLLLRIASPPLAMPPPARGGPSPRLNAAVAVLPFTSLLLTTRWLPDGLPPLPLDMPPPFGAVLRSIWLLLRVTDPSRFWIPPPPPALGALLSSTWLLLRVRKLVVPEKLR